MCMMDKSESSRDSEKTEVSFHTFSKHSCKDIFCSIIDYYDRLIIECDKTQK